MKKGKINVACIFGVCHCGVLNCFSVSLTGSQMNINTSSVSNKHGNI